MIYLYGNGLLSGKAKKQSSKSTQCANPGKRRLPYSARQPRVTLRSTPGYSHTPLVNPGLRDAPPWATRTRRSAAKNTLQAAERRLPLAQGANPGKTTLHTGLFAHAAPRLIAEHGTLTLCRSAAKPWANLTTSSLRTQHRSRRRRPSWAVHLLEQHLHRPCWHTSAGPWLPKHASAHLWQS